MRFLSNQAQISTVAQEERWRGGRAGAVPDGAGGEGDGAGSTGRGPHSRTWQQCLSVQGHNISKHFQTFRNFRNPAESVDNWMDLCWCGVNWQKRALSDLPQATWYIKVSSSPSVPYSADKASLVVRCVYEPQFD